MALITFVLLNFILTTLLSSARSQTPLFSWCYDTSGNFTANSTYQSNLNLAFSSLLSTSPSTGFNTSISGSVPDRVFALALCRGDVDTSTCRSCLEIATSDAEQYCPYRKKANIFYDNCLLRYSDQRFISALEWGDRVFLQNSNNVSSGQAARFNASVWAVLRELQGYAVDNATSPPMFAAGEILLGGQYPKIYALVQCTRDISADNCDQCLGNIIPNLPSCCGGKIGGRVLAGSCNFRYETYSFFNWSRTLSIPAVSMEAPTTPSLPPLSSPPVGPPKGDNGTRETTNSTGGSKNTTAVALAISVPVGATILILILIGFICFHKKRKSPDGSRNRLQPEMPTTESAIFDLATIKRATDNFSTSNKLGEGGYGPVYKGRLSDGREIAVKRLSASSGQGIEELKNEMMLLAKLQHRNLVRLFGVCVEGGEKSLVYEFLANKSLDVYLSEPIKKLLLTWEKRYKIIAGVARGLLYLHEESQVRIVHRDLKASNILLDGDMTPKISDFGLARLFHGDESRARTDKVAGTLGYMSPEYVMRGQYSIKSDVYSFGILVLEIITGRRNTDLLSEGSDNSTDLLNYVWDHWSRERATDVVDPSMEGKFSRTEAMRCVQIGLLCVQRNPRDRPSMSSVALMLGSASMSISSPLQPVFMAEYSNVPNGLSTDASGNSGGSSADAKTDQLASLNDVTISEFDPR